MGGLFWFRSHRENNNQFTKKQGYRHLKDSIFIKFHKKIKFQAPVAAWNWVKFTQHFSFVIFSIVLKCVPNLKKIRVGQVQHLVDLTWNDPYYNESFHTKSTGKNEFWTWPSLIFFKFGTHFDTIEKIPKPKFWVESTQFQATMRSSKFYVFAKFDQNFYFRMPLTLFFHEFNIFFSTAPKSERPPQKLHLKFFA